MLAIVSSLAASVEGSPGKAVGLADQSKLAVTAPRRVGMTPHSPAKTSHHNVIFALMVQQCKH